MSLDLDQFIQEHRQKFKNEDNNKFAFAFGDIERYYSYLLIILARYQEKSEELTQNSKKIHALSQTDSDQDELLKLLNENRRISNPLHLEIESFYLFADITLDKIAQAIIFYFGKPTKKMQIGNHRSFVKNFSNYTSNRNLLDGDRAEKSAKRLQKSVSQFRNRQLIHIQQDGRIMRGTIWTGEGRSKLVISKLYPQNHDQQQESAYPEDLLGDISAYIEQMIEFVKHNQANTTLTTK